MYLYPKIVTANIYGFSNYHCWPLQKEDAHYDEISSTVPTTICTNNQTTLKHDTIFSRKAPPVQGNNSRRVRTGILYVEEKYQKPYIELPRGENGGTIKCQCPYCGVIRPGKFSIGKPLQ